MIDSHQHFWAYSEPEFDWITDEMSEIRRDFLPADLKQEMDRAGVSGCMSVQAAQTLEETRFLLGLAETHNFILGVVGWVDLRSPDVADTLEELARHPKLKGVRHIVQAEVPGFLSDQKFLSGVRALGEVGLTYDILIREHQLEEANLFVRAASGVKMVLDHVAKPDIRNQSWEPWATGIRQLAECENVFCKLSGMSFEANWTTWNAETLQPYVDHVLSCFGPDRCMFGSDWPVCLPAGSYGKTLEGLRECLEGLSESESSDIWQGTATRFYGL